MAQRESSRIRNKDTRATIPVGTLISLVNQKKLLLTRRRNDITSLIRSIEKRQCLTDVIEEQHLLEPRNPEVGIHIQDDSTKHVPRNPEVEEQVQLNSTTIEVKEQCDEQDSSTQKRERGPTKMLIVHGRHDRKLIVLNKGGQPVGPSNDVVIKLSSFLDIGTQKNFRKKRGKCMILHHLRNFLWLQEKENPIDHTRIQMKSIVAEMENIEMQQNEDGNETIDAFAFVMGSKHPGCLRFYGIWVTKTTLEGKVRLSKPYQMQQINS